MKEEANNEVKLAIKFAKLIDLRAAESDECQILNATEGNKHFSSAFERIGKLERLVNKQEK